MTWKDWEGYQPPAPRVKDLGVQVPPQGGTGAAIPIVMADRRRKFHNQPQWVLADLRVVRAQAMPLPGGALWFQSKREADRFVALRLELEARAISDLRLQPQFPLNVVTANGVRVVIGRWIGDFAYVRDGHEVVEDAKGVRTDLYKWKLAHVEAQYGIRIREV